ncbi:MAG: CHASE2 domain-containing protein [Parvularculaceae bacterium]
MATKAAIASEVEPQRRKGAAGVFAAAAIFAFTALLCLNGAEAPLNFALMDMRFRLLERAPSGTLVVVAIDPYSLKEEDRWPWPRDRYARVVENLQDAGAELIAFDIDFSSRSDAEGDEAFATALSRKPGEVILPVFWQWSSRQQSDDLLIKTRPNDIFIQDAVIASVTLTPEKNGAVRRGWRSFEDDGAERQSIAATLAGAPAGGDAWFYIDYSFDPSMITQLSFRDVFTGDFEPEQVRGKNILIGSTALEFGDEFPAPVYGVQPGVMFHALAYESLLNGRALIRLHPLIPLLAAALLIFAIVAPHRMITVRQTLFRHAIVATVLVAGPIAIQAVTPVSVDTGAVLIAQGMCSIYTFSRRLRIYATQLLAHRAATARYQALTGVVVRDNADGVIVANCDGVVELANYRAGALLGADVAPGAHLAKAAAGFPVYDCKETRSMHGEYIVAREREPVTLEVVASPSAAGGEGEAAQLIVYTLRDISARKRIEAAEKEVMQAAIAADRMKSELISNMSHELRTPLNAVIGFSEIMRQEAFGPVGVPEYKEYADNIHISGKRLLGLVNDMLSIAKLDAGEYELARSMTYIDEVVESVLTPYEQMARDQEKSIRAEIEKGMPAFEIDPGVFAEMISHLLSNAMKFTEAGGKILVRAQRRDKALVIDVIDDGCGAPKASLPNLAEPFYQADGSLNRRHEGAGLGLYLVSKFAALHGGALKYDSDVGQGFIARLTFPKLTADKQRNAA